MVQPSQVVQSTKKKTPPPISVKKVIFKDAPEEEEMDAIPPPIKTKGLHIWDQLIIKLYMDGCGRFPIRSSNSND